MKRATLLALLAVLASACTEATPASSSAESSIPASASSPSPGTSAQSVGNTEMAPDPVGDSLPATTGYLDTAAYGVSSARSKFSFVFEVAEAIPVSFTVPMDFDAAQYSFCLGHRHLVQPRRLPVCQ